MKTLWQNCHAATMAQGVYSIIEDAAIVTQGEHIQWTVSYTHLTLPTILLV